MVQKIDSGEGYGVVPPGFKLARHALIEFHNTRVDAPDPEDRGLQSKNLKMLVANALQAGTLVVFIRTPEGSMHTVPPDAWRSSAGNLEKLHKSGHRHDDPLVLEHAVLTTSGIALFEQHNWLGFATYADRWPTYEIPDTVKLLLLFCEHRKTINEAYPLQKADVIAWFRANWPIELEAEWTKADRKRAYNSGKGDQCPSLVSRMAEIILPKSEREGGMPPAKFKNLVIDRRRQIAIPVMTAKDFADEISLIENDV